MAMRVLKIAKYLVSCLLVASAVYIGYCHLTLIQQRHTTEDFLAKVKTWKLNETTESDLRKDLARFRRVKESCSEGTCWWEYDYTSNRSPHHPVLQFFGIRWSQVAFFVAVKNGVFDNADFKYATEYPGTTKWFQVAGSPPIFTIPEGHTTWVFSPNVDTPGGGTALFHLYSSQISGSDWKRIWTINTACISQWHPCRQFEEVIPEAWKEYLMQKRRGELSTILRKENGQDRSPAR